MRLLLMITKFLLTFYALLLLQETGVSAQQVFFFADEIPGAFPGQGSIIVYGGAEDGNISPLLTLPEAYGVGDVEYDGSEIFTLASYQEQTWIWRGSERWHDTYGAFSQRFAVGDLFVYYYSIGGPGIFAIDKLSGGGSYAYSTGFVSDVEFANGSLYWAEQGLVFKDGELIATFPATSVALAIGPDGSVFAYYGDGVTGFTVARVHPDGAISYMPPFATGSCSGDGSINPLAGDIEVRPALGAQVDIYLTLRGNEDVGSTTTVFKNGSSIACSRLADALGVALPNESPSCGGPLLLAYGGVFSRVDIHGVPLPERSPTQAAEVDRQDSAIYVDAYALTPYLSASDVRVPLEGGDLELEFRRTASVSSNRSASDVARQALTYPSDRILGPGWHSNLSSRITLADETCLSVSVATVVDEVGTSYRYIDTGFTGKDNPLPPDTLYSINNQAESATLHRLDPSTLVLEKTFGATLTYQRLGTFFHPTGGNEADYYRLVSIEDRNGNRVVWSYLSNDSLERESFHVAEMYEEGHPERRISFTYSLGTGGNGTDWGDRLTTAVDALGHETVYGYGPSNGYDGQFLISIARESVFDGENESLVAPQTTFSYHVVELPVEEAIDPLNPPPADPLTKNRWVGLSSVTDPRGHVTTLAYETGYFPSSIAQGLAPNQYLARIHLTDLTTDDGTVTFNRIAATHESVITEVVDTRGNLTTYSFSGATAPADNLIGKALYVTELERTTAIGSVRYTWSGDSFSNLLSVEDLNDNTVEFEYGTPIAQRSSQPTRETITDTGAAASISTDYSYGIFSRLQQVVDGEGKATNHTLDSQGNRRFVNEELGKTTEYEYEPDGFVKAMIDADVRRTEYSRAFFPLNLARYYLVTETVRGYGNELDITTVRTYDVMGNLVEVKNPNNNVYYYKYDALYRLVEKQEPISGSAQTTYTLHGGPVKETDFLGNVSLRSYDSMHRVTEERRRMNGPSVNSPEDLVTTYTYGPAGEILTRTDPEGTVYGLQYDAALRPTRKTFDEGGFNYQELYEYGPNSGSGAFSYIDGYQPTRVTNRRGFHTDTTYDGFYRRVRTIERASPATAYGAPPALNEPATEYAYNKAHNEIRRTVIGEPDAGGNRVLYTFYDDLHRVAGTAIDFDGDGNNGAPYGETSGIIGTGVAFTGDSDDQVTVLHLDLSGNQVAVLDPEGNLTETLFDGANRPYLVRQPAVPAGVPEALTFYDDNGNPTLLIDPRGTQTQVSYDERNRETRRILDLNGDAIFDPTFSGPDIVTVQEYDLVDNITGRTDSRGNTYNFEYDLAYREIRRLGPAVTDHEDGGVFGGVLRRPLWSTEYDRNANRIREIDPRLVVKKMEYDELSRLVGETTAFGSPEPLQTTFEYDQEDNVTARTLDNGTFGLQRTEFTYDSFNRQDSEVWPGARLTTFEYYRNDLLKKKTNPKGQAVEYEYDVAGRTAVTRYLRSDSQLEEQRLFSYDRANNPVIVQDLCGTTFRSYDALYRLTREQRDYADPSSSTTYSYVVEHGYDLNGNQTHTKYPTSARRTVRRTFDRADRLDVVLDEGEPNTTIDDHQTEYRYDAAGNTTSVLAANRVLTTRIYDALDRATSSVSAKNGNVVYQAAYEFDLVGNRRTITERVRGQAKRSISYGYDAQYRITRESVGGEDILYIYDFAGNRLTKQGGSDLTQYTYNERNELEESQTGSSLTTYGYDLNGNLAQRDTTGTLQTYTWDTKNRLVSSAENGTEVFEAQYDYRTRRVLKEEGGERTYYVYAEYPFTGRPA